MDDCTVPRTAIGCGTDLAVDVVEDRVTDRARRGHPKSLSFILRFNVYFSYRMHGKIRPN